MMNEKQIAALNLVKKYFGNNRSKFEVISNIEVDMWENDAYVKIDTKHPKYDNPILDGFYSFLIGKQGRIFTYAESKNGKTYKKYHKVFEVIRDCKVY